MDITTNIVRGGQLFLHSLRMLRQVLNALSSWSLILGLLAFGIKIYLSLTKQELLGCIYYHIGELLHNLKLDTITIEVWMYSRLYNIPASHVATYPCFIEAKNITHTKLIVAFVFGYQVFVITFITLTVAFVKRGLSKSGRQFLRGAKLDDFLKVKQEITKRNKSKNHENSSNTNTNTNTTTITQNHHTYLIAGMPYPYMSESEHTLIIGSTGSGKTVLISDLVEQIRKKGERAIIYDKKCDYIKWFYDPKKDIILNPFDVRGAKWNLLAEIDHIAQLKSIVASFIPDKGTYSDNAKIWDEAARIAFSGILEKLICTGANLTNKEIVDRILSSDITEVAQLVRNTYAQSTLDMNSPKTAASVMFVLATHFGALRLTSGTKEESFSIKRWLRGINNNNHNTANTTNSNAATNKQDSILFISSAQDLNSELSPLITAWFEIAINGILSNIQQPQSQNSDTQNPNPNSNPRTWIILDELPSIQKIPSLSQGLSVARSYQGCFVLGAQNIAQLREVYGHNITQSISSECNTRAFFKTNDPDTASWICDNIGHAETVQYKEALSYGAHAMRDGVNVGAYEKTQSLILPSEIISMPKLNLFLKLPDFPCVKASVKYKVRQSIADCLKVNTKLMQEMQKIYDVNVDGAGNIADDVSIGLKTDAVASKDITLKKDAAVMPADAVADSDINADTDADMIDNDTYTIETKNILHHGVQIESKVEAKTITLIPTPVPTNPTPTTASKDKAFSEVDDTSSDLNETFKTNSVHYLGSIQHNGLFIDKQPYTQKENTQALYSNTIYEHEVTQKPDYTINRADTVNEIDGSNQGVNRTNSSSKEEETNTLDENAPDETDYQNPTNPNAKLKNTSKTSSLKEEADCAF